MNEVAQRFSALPWHDSELLGFQVEPGSGATGAMVSFDLNLNENPNGMRPARLEFHNSRALFAEVDLLGKRLCSDQIASASCKEADESQEAFVDRINDRFDLDPERSTAGLFLFRIALIRPGGMFLVVAENFAVTDRAT